MHLPLHLIVVILAFISYEHEAIAQYVPPYTSIVVPITKRTDAAKPLYSVQIMTTYVNSEFLHTNLLIDIDAPFTWNDCIVQWNIYPGSCPSNTLCTSPVSCEEYQCTDVRTTYSYEHNPPCPPVTNSSTLPGWGFCTCPVNVVNPVTGSCDEALLNYEEFTVNTSNGRNVFTGFLLVTTNSACVPSSSLESFPANVTGVMAFSSSSYALQRYLVEPLKNSLAICLPSNSSAPGVLFFGSGPYYLLPNSGVDVRSLLSYTPLLKHPDSLGYYIGVKAIVIKNKSIGITGSFSTKLSTLEPYTILRTDIYKRVIWAFSVATIGIPLARPVSPFGLCYKAIGTHAGLKFPNIDFSLEDGKKWTVDMANSIKQITKDVACLAFVDGGATAEHAIVIGTYQFEDNFLVFDLENSTFGFSSSLLHQKTSCSNFNFTVTDDN
ncbi:putative aspartic peptidase A1 family, aspartic peptidase domain superfamily, xylanase inhibitor [Helianthus annuus]|nr:putative aspartic peptidase A1 family, aspartic peptidase domain superfamily, xylanase inhibitor [Helianthus annuus]KAJ0885086.1 putative aspartic peptidase A1 family, aspartic peptidase domain superfamily, xylanase inhibitor [Helianthus annuus]